MACTWFEFENNQKHAFIGRTMELPGDLQNRVYYFRAYNNYDIRKIELADIDFAETEFTSDTLYTPSKYEQFEFN